MVVEETHEVFKIPLEAAAAVEIQEEESWDQVLTDAGQHKVMTDRSQIPELPEEIDHRPAVLMKIALDLYVLQPTLTITTEMIADLISLTE